MNTKVYLKILFLSLGMIMAVAIAYVLYFNAHYPLPITNRISFDAKIKFIREHIDINEVDTLIIGSSIGLNNIDGVVLEKTSKHIEKALNLSIYGATATQIEQLYELVDAFPNVKRVIYSAQYSDFSNARYYDSYNPDVLKKYIKDELNIIEHFLLLFRACNNLQFCINRQMQWDKKHMQDNEFEYLGFDTSGSVALNIYGDDIIKHRWRLPQPGIMHAKSFESVFNMAKKAKAKNIKFYLVHQPYRQALYNKHKKVKEAMRYFDERVNKIFTQMNAELITLQNSQVGDEYFADRTHLNAKGSKFVSKIIGKMIDKSENN